MLHAALLLLVQAPPATYEEVEAKMHAAYRALTDYRETMNVRVQSDSATSVTQWTKCIAKDRSRMTIRHGGVTVLDTGYDGLGVWLVLHPDRVYGRREAENAPFSAPYKPIDLSKEADGYFNFTYTEVYDVRILSKPGLKPVTMQDDELDGKPMARLVSEAPGLTAPGRLRVTQWFHRGTWIVAKFDIEADSRDGKKLRISGIATDVSFDAKLAQKDFAFDPGIAVGYRKVEPPEGS